MTASLPPDVQAVFDRFITTELTTVDRAGQPITWPVTPYYRPGDPCIDITTGLGYPKKADDARANPLVSLLFSDPTGSGLNDPPMVLVQGSAEVDDRDLDANRERYARESAEKLPRAVRRLPPEPLRRFFGWYFDRIYVHVRPERVYVWPPGTPGGEPELYDAHMEEVRSGHSEEPERFHAGPEGGGSSLASPDARARHALSDRRRVDRLARRLPVRDARPGPRRRGQPLHLHRRAARGRAAAAGPGLPDRARPRAASSRGRRTSRSAAIWSSARTAGSSCRTGSSAGSRRRRRGSRCCALTPARPCGSAAPPSASWLAGGRGRCEAHNACAGA